MVLSEGEAGWISPYPSVIELTKLLFGLMRSHAGDYDVSQEAAKWLQGLGAVQVQSFLDRLASGGSTEQGKLLLRQGVMAMNQVKPVLNKLNLMSTEQFDQVMETFYREVTPERIGQTSYVDTLARKPLLS